MKRKVLIVGGGALGMSAAYHLSRKGGHEVTVIDRQYPASGSSGLSAGIYTRQYADREELELRCRAYELLSGLEAEKLLDLERIGFLRIGRSDEDLAAFETSVAGQHELGAPEARIVDPEQIAELVPGFNLEGVLAGLYNPNDGYMDGSQFCNSLAERVQAAGGNLRVRCELLGCEKTGSGRYVATTSKGEIEADVIVNAAGPWVEQVGQRLGAPTKVLNERHEVFVFELGETRRKRYPMVLDYVPGGGAPGLYFRSEGDHQLLVGLHSNEPEGEPVPDPDDYFRGVRDESTQEIVPMLAEALPAIEEIGLRGGWAGLYPHSPENRLEIGPHPLNPDIIVGAGLGGIGLSTAITLGEIVAEWVTEGKPVTLPWADRYAPK